MNSCLRLLPTLALVLLVAQTSHDVASRFRSPASASGAGRKIHVIFNLGADLHQEEVRHDGGQSAYNERAAQIRQVMEPRGWEIIELNPTSELASDRVGLMRTLNRLPDDLRELNLTFLGHAWRSPLPSTPLPNLRKDARSPGVSSEWSEYAQDTPDTASTYILQGASEQTLLAADVRNLLHGVLSRNPRLQIHVDVLNCFGGALALTLAGLPRTETYSASPAATVSVSVWRPAAERHRYEDYLYYFYRSIADGANRHQAHEDARHQMLELSRNLGNLNLANNLSFLPITPIQSYANRWCHRETPSLQLSAPEPPSTALPPAGNVSEALQTLENSAQAVLHQFETSARENGCTVPEQLERMEHEEGAWTRFLFDESVRWSNTRLARLPQRLASLHARCHRRPQLCLFYWRAHLRGLEQESRPAADLDSCRQQVGHPASPANVIEDLRWSESMRACLQRAQAAHGNLSYGAISWVLIQADRQRFEWRERYCEHSDHALAALQSDLGCARRFIEEASSLDHDRLNQVYLTGKPVP